MAAAPESDSDSGMGSPAEAGEAKPEKRTDDPPGTEAEPHLSSLWEDLGFSRAAAELQTHLHPSCSSLISHLLV